MTPSPLRARVSGGRLLLDEPTSLPDGTVVELVPMDDLDDAERARLLGFLGESIRTHLPGAGVPAREVLTELRRAP